MNPAVLAMLVMLAFHGEAKQDKKHVAHDKPAQADLDAFRVAHADYLDVKKVTKNVPYEEAL